MCAFVTLNKKITYLLTYVPELLEGQNLGEWLMGKANSCSIENCLLLLSAF